MRCWSDWGIRTCDCAILGSLRGILDSYCTDLKRFEAGDVCSGRGLWSLLLMVALNVVNEDPNRDAEAGANNFISGR